MEVHVEPVLPQPQLVAIGRSPAAIALTALAAAMGWRSLAVDDGGDPAEHPSADRMLATLDLTDAGVDERSFVVVATQGHYDEAALEQALATPAAYIGLVASRKRADSVLGYLRDRGVPSEEQLARVHAPAGLDLGRSPRRTSRSRSSPEIVQLRAAEQLRPAVAETPIAAHEEIDPGVRHDRGGGRRALHDGPRRAHLLLLLGRLPVVVRGRPRRVRLGRPMTRPGATAC